MTQHGIWAVATSGVMAFIATNIDDLLLLTIFFSQVNSTFRKRHVVLGQYLGFTVLILASLPGFLGGLVISPAWIGLLGLVPIGLGINQLWHRESTASDVQAVNEGGLSPSDSPTAASPEIAVPGIWRSLFNPQIYAVAMTTIANGGDNIGIYVPLFASSDRNRLGITLLIFFGLIGLWCLIAQQLTRQPTITRLITRYGNTFVPIVLIGLGIFIMFESGTFNLFLPNL
ncbi:cadmium resistance transporter [Trichocoleus sp. FACHB-262]|uniref:cadmium resistance transporter n=1 Tax=Trichocoleus sp. FACHB-262 TaxID=2692869 RepID=UPI0028C39A2F|nr:cadmium resistance transporter [Trichocoleus sp. FACHB-262]